MSVPSLCIHLDREPEFKPNKETHLKPILATKTIDALMGEAVKDESVPDVYNIKSKNFETFLTRISDDLEISTDQIIDFELSLYDTQ